MLRRQMFFVLLDIYGCEYWVQINDYVNNIQVAEMQFCRRLLRVSWKNRKTNDSVLAELRVQRTLLTIVNRRELKYLGHAIQTSRTDLTKTTF